MKYTENRNKNRIIQRLKIIEGQIRGLQEMVGKSTYCINIITQTSAVKNALSRIEDMMLENHLSTCAADQIKAGNIEKAKKEILKVYQLKKN